MNDPFHQYEPDAELDALLDEALSADEIEMPAGMTDRIVAQTMPLLAAQPAVVGRIESYSFVMRIAAGLLVAASVGVAIIASNMRQEATSDAAARLAAANGAKQATVVASATVPLLDEIEQARIAPTTSGTFAVAHSRVDETIDQLKARTQEINAGVEQWATVTESLEQALNDMELPPDNG